MTNAKNNETKQEQELKSCPVAAALARLRGDARVDGLPHSAKVG